MKIELAPNQSVCQEPPKPPPLPPPPIAITPNGETNGQSSKTNTINSTNGNGSGLQDTATRKQQQPLSAISIQDLNSVQVSPIANSLIPRQLFKFPTKKNTF